jgi:ankyrin repeat protein
VLSAVISCAGVVLARDAPQLGTNSMSLPTLRLAAVDTRGEMQISPLLSAVGAGDIGRVKELLDSGVLADDPSSSRSPLIQAITNFRGSGALYCDIAIVRVLLERGADPNRADPQMGALPLLSAFDVGDAECARILKNAGARADIRGEGGRTILMSAVGAAARTGNVGLLDLAISWNAGVNDRALDGATALHEAVRINGSGVATSLLDRGVNPCLKNDIGQTPLDMALNLRRSAALIDVLRRATHCPAPG